MQVAQALGEGYLCDEALKIVLGLAGDLLNAIPHFGYG